MSTETELQNEDKENEQLRKDPNANANANATANPLADTRPTFVPSEDYNGPRTGYYFAKGSLGVGYYLDDAPVQTKNNANNKPKLSAKAQKAESMARAERFLAGQDKGKAARYWVPNHDPSRYTSKKQRKKSKRQQSSSRQKGVPNKYEQSRFVDEGGQIGLDKEEDGSFQTRMDFEDIRDDFPLRSR